MPPWILFPEETNNDSAAQKRTQEIYINEQDMRENEQKLAFARSN